MNLFNRFRSNRRRSASSQLEFQKLEDRNLLAGDVTVFVDNIALFVVGDGQANQIQIVGTANGSARVVGLDGTTINGGKSAFNANLAGLRAATVNLGGGGDTITVQGARFNRGLEINAGGGDDSLTVKHSSLGQMILRGQAGDDTISIDNVFTIGTADISLGEGNNMLAVLAQAAGEDFRVHGGSGADTLAVANLGMFGAMDVDLAGGNDQMLLAGETYIGRDSMIGLGSGNDFLGVLPEQLGASSQLRQSTMIDGGGGSDNVVIGSNVTSQEGTAVNGNAGTDGIQYGDSDLSNTRVTNFENSAFDQQALLDAVYSLLEEDGFDSEMFGGDIIADFSASLADVFLSLPENSPATSIDSSLTIDGPQETIVTGAVVTLKGFVAGEDSLQFVDTADITGTFDDTTGILTLTGDSSLSDYQTALRSVRVLNNSEDPSTTERSIQIEVTNSTGETVFDSRDLNVISVADAPVLSVVDTAIDVDLSDSQNMLPVTVDNQLTVSDVDTTQFSSATVAIDGFQPGDTLSFTEANGITGNFDADNGILTLTGEATVEQYQEALRTVEFNSTADNVRVGTRTIRFTVTDGASSVSDDVDVNLTSSQLSISTESTLTEFTETDDPVAIAPGLMLDVGGDPNAVISGATVRASSNYLFTQDLISFVPIDGVSGSLDETTGTLTFTGDAIASEYQKLLQNVTYGNNGTENDITAGVRTFEFTVQNSGVEVVAQKSIQVNRLTDEAKIQAYLDANDLVSQRTDSGLHYIVDQEGNGTFPQQGGQARVSYVGRLISDGSEFDSSSNFLATLTPGRLIAGWVEGIPLFSEGGSGKLIIPADLAYGTRGQGTIPPNAVLEFDIEILEVLS